MAVKKGTVDLVIPVPNTFCGLTIYKLHIVLGTRDKTVSQDKVLTATQHAAEKPWNSLNKYTS